jgi:phospholipid-binding lipoprotein MlaA
MEIDRDAKMPRPGSSWVFMSQGLGNLQTLLPLATAIALLSLAPLSALSQEGDDDTASTTAQASSEPEERPAELSDDPDDGKTGSASLGEYDPLFDEEMEEISGFPDPFETMNRGTFRVNREIDRFVLSPIATGYRFIVPSGMRKSVRNLLANFNSLPILVNDSLQLEWKDARTTFARLIINSTIGLAGLFDPAARWGMKGHHSDFGQTLTLSGVDSGPYLIIPFLGPTTLRDGTGQIVDTLLRPTVYFFGPVELLFYEGTSGIAKRDEHDEALTALRESSLDFYAAMRSAFYQTRAAHIWKRREHRREQ